MAYWILILVLIIVFISTVRLADNAQAIDYFGFAGTLVGIILAVVALIYSFYQSTTYVGANEKLDISANKIERVTESLDETNEHITRQLNGTMSEMKDSLKHTLNTVNQGFFQISASMQEQLDQNAIMRSSLDKVHETVQETKYNLASVLEMSNGVTKEEPSVNELKNFITYYVQFQGIFQSLFLYYLIEIKKINKEGNIYNVISWGIENKLAFDYENFQENEDILKSFVYQNNVGMFWDIFFELSSGGLIQLEGRLSKTIVKSINSDLEEAINTKIETSMSDDLKTSFMVMINQNEQ
jgi:hypothetical protein